jgi:hypothetical protein
MHPNLTTLADYLFTAISSISLRGFSYLLRLLYLGLHWLMVTYINVLERWLTRLKRSLSKSNTTVLSSCISLRFEGFLSLPICRSSLFCSWPLERGAWISVLSPQASYIWFGYYNTITEGGRNHSCLKTSSVFLKKFIALYYRYSFYYLIRCPFNYVAKLAE